MCSNEPIERFEHAGLRVSIYQDECADSPGDWADKHLFLVADHSDFSVKGTSYIVKPSDALCRYTCDEEHEHTKECPREGRVTPGVAADYHVFLLYAYIHSGVMLCLGDEITERTVTRDDAKWEAPFDPGGWDTSMLGLVLVSRQPGEFGDRTPEQAAESLIEEWNTYLSGDVYAIVVERKRRYEKRYIDTGELELGQEWETVESVGGCYGLDHTTAEAKTMAESAAKISKRACPGGLKKDG